MFIQRVCDITCAINSFLHICIDWMLTIPVLKYLAIALNWVFDGIKTIQYRLLFEDIINLQPDPDVYSQLHYKVNYGLHSMFALIGVLIALFIVCNAIAIIASKIKGKNIKKLENKVNAKFSEIGSCARYQCLFEDWKYMETYDKDPYEEACIYMRELMSQIDQFIASGGNGADITCVYDVHRLTHHGWEDCIYKVTDSPTGRVIE